MVSVENLKIQWGKNGEVQGEKKKKKPYLLLRKKRKVKIYFKLITEITSKEENWEKGNELIFKMLLF